MALNFPDNPSVNDIYRDSTSGFGYQWDGTVWQSYSDSSLGQIKILDDISGSFNGSTQTFALTSSSTAITPANTQQIRVTLDGAVQDPANDYTVSGSNITFTTPPAGGLSFSGVVFGAAVPINTIIDGSITPEKLSVAGPIWDASGNLSVTGIVTATDFDSSSDLNLKENVQVIENAIDKLVGISGVTFEWKNTSDLSAGVIAQDVEKVFPEVVKTNDYKTVNYNGLIALLIEAVKELQQRINVLENKTQ